MLLELLEHLGHLDLEHPEAVLRKTLLKLCGVSGKAPWFIFAY